MTLESKKAARDQLQANLQKLSPFENFYVGVVSGCLEVLFMQPVLFCKNASQQSRSLSFNPRVLYRGVGVSMLNMGVLTGLQFPLTNFVTRFMTGGVKRRLSDNEMVVSSAIGGLISGIVASPMELLLIQQQNFGGSLPACLSKIFRSHGFAGLSRGMMGSMGREGLWCCGYMGLGPVFQRYFSETGWNEHSALMLGSILSGVIVATLSHPMDTIKTCMQGDIERNKYTTVMGTSKTLASEGFQRFFWGWGWRTGRAIFGVLLLSSCKDRLTQVLAPHHFK
jgi:hypothetical protein